MKMKPAGKTKGTGTGRRGKIRVLIVDDHPIVREGVMRIIEREDDMAVCCEAEDASSALACLRSGGCDIATVDLSLKGKSGLELMKDMLALKPGFPILVLSVHDDTHMAERALGAGARGYVMKHQAPRLIIDAIRRVLKGEVYVCNEMTTKLLSRFVKSRRGGAGEDAVARLSDRELEILELIGKGLGTKRTASALNISVSTVETHRARIKEKLNIATAPELARFAVEWVLKTRAK